MVSDDEEEEIVVVSRVDIGLTNEEILTLQATIDPLQPCEDWGIQLYKTTVDTVYSILQQ